RVLMMLPLLTVLWADVPRYCPILSAPFGDLERSTGLPSEQLVYVSEIPPSQWELEGSIAASDFAKLLLRRQQVGRDFPQLLAYRYGARDYSAEDFDRLKGPDIIKVVLRKEELTILQVPERLVSMKESRIMVPLLVKNNLPRPTTLRMQMPQ